MKASTSTSTSLYLYLCRPPTSSAHDHDGMLTSSPTITTASLPSNAFHTITHGSHHASRRTTAPSSAHSPRFASPIATATPSSPQTRKRAYTDAGTQYTPEGLPPTHRPQPSAEGDPLTASAIATESQQLSQESDVRSRAGALPASPAYHAMIHPPTRRTPKQKAHSPLEPEQPTLPNAASTILHAAASPAKRARSHDDRTIQLMPLQYETCDVKHLGVLISDMLMELVHLNDGFPLRDGTLTRFHSRAPPGISVRDYLSRLIVHATLSPPILLSMVFYVDKLCAMYPAFTISSLTVHRFLITAATVAAKGLSDSFWTNSLYARVGGVSVRELALLELEFLRKLDWRIVPKPEVLVDYYKGLVDRGPGYAIEKEACVEVASVPPRPQPSSPPDSATGIHTQQTNM